MRGMRTGLVSLARVGVALLLTAGTAVAEEAPKVDTGDTAWMLTSAALVLMMTAPGLALFYGGLVRSKNGLATIMQSFVMMALISVQWVLWGYTLAFGPDHGHVIGGLNWLGLNGVGGAPNADYAPTIPHQCFMIYQCMFAIITPALITGAFAERMKFSAFLLFSLLWATLIYDPLAHWVWGKGGWIGANGGMGALDFAGGTVVHISAGVSALAAALVMGKRLGYPREPMPPHNLPFSVVGAAMLWVGWFGFNAGSALNAGTLATSAFAATHFSAAAAALSWAVVEWFHKGRPSVLGAASGMVAGLATITPASGFVTVPAAFCIGLAAGVVCYLAVTKLKAKFSYDDSLDVFGVHAVGSITGMLMLGFLANTLVNPAIASTFQANGVTVSLAGGASQFANQLKAVLFTVAFAGIASFILLQIVNRLVGLRVDVEDEDAGLDLTQHGERAYSE